MIRRHASAGYAFSFLIACAVAGLLYLGVVLLTNTTAPPPAPIFEGAIRLAGEAAREPATRQEQQSLEQPEAPPESPKVFAASPQAVPRPDISLDIPAFDLGSRLTVSGGMAVPPSVGGSPGFLMEEVDEQPRVVSRVSPKYPYGARKKHIEGRVVVRMLVTSEGRPMDLSIQEANPPGVFENASLEAARRWRFKPGRYEGRNVDTWVLLPFNFSLVQ